MKKVISICRGDGIGHEVVEEGIKILKIIEQFTDFSFDCQDAPAGGGTYKKFGTPLPEKSINSINNSDAVLFGGIGDPDVPPGIAERATFNIRQGFDMYVNLRPVKLYDVLKDRCPLKDDYIEKGIDITFIRENVEGVYAGFDVNLRDEYSHSIQVCTRSITERLIKYAFESAKEKNHKIISSVDKANVMEASRLWRKIFHEIGQDYPNIQTEDFYMDAFSLMLIKEPYRFQTIVTDNLYGDIVTDQAAILVGGLGITPSGNINPNGISMYEPVHGSAPDIAGKNIANPVATILSIKLMMEESFDSPIIGERIEKSVLKVLEEARTEDIKNRNLKTVSTNEMGDLIANELKSQLKT